jgi:hypothetical protein
MAFSGQRFTVSACSTSAPTEVLRLIDLLVDQRVREIEDESTMANPPNPDPERVMAILSKAKTLAREYYALTGRPLGVTGEVAEFEAVRLLGLELTPVRTAGYDAVRQADGRRFQIKGRRLLPGCKPGQRIGKIDVTKEFDGVLLVLMDEDFNAYEIYEADRAPVIAALAAPGSRSRNERGALGVAKVQQIGRQVWAKA